MDCRVEKFNLRDYFEDFICSGYVGYAKSDRKIYRIFLERAGAEPEECLFIDNKERNLKPAREMGFETVLFEGKEQLERELKSCGVL